LSRFRRATRDLSVAAAFSLFVNAGWEITGLPQLADYFIGGSGLDQPGRFLSPGIEGDVVVSRHDEVY
jgi:hypothetical protein